MIVVLTVVVVVNEVGCVWYGGIERERERDTEGEGGGRRGGREQNT